MDVVGTLLQINFNFIVMKVCIYYFLKIINIESNGS